MIPKNIFQTHKSHEYLRDNKELFQAAFSWYKNKEYTYKFYTDKDCDVFNLTSNNTQSGLLFNIAEENMAESMGIEYYQTIE